MASAKYLGWILALFVLTIIVVIIYPNQNLIFFAIVFLPFLLVLQVYLILRQKSDKPDDKTFEDWYDR